MTRPSRIAALHAAAKDRILVLDGSWGVMIQRRGLSEAEFRGQRFADHPVQLKGDNDLLCITRPDSQMPPPALSKIWLNEASQ